mgnify:CR=1 FL=1
MAQRVFLGVATLLFVAAAFAMILLGPGVAITGWLFWLLHWQARCL